MFARIVDYLANELIDNQVIAESDKEIYAFGIRALFTQSAHVMIVLLLGYGFNLFFESIVFLFTYMPLRIYAGGYHAPTNTRCFISSIFMIIVVLSLIKSIPSSMVFSSALVMGIIAIAIIFYYAPVENKNKPLDAIEQIVYRRKAIIITTFIGLGIISSLLIQKETIGLTLSLSLLAESILILVELQKNYKKFES